jgi:hypothetical protein
MKDSSLNVFDNGAVLLQSIFWTFSTVSFFLYHYVYRQRLASSTGPTRVGTPEDKGRAIPQNLVVEKHGDNGESPKNRSQK